MAISPPHRTLADRIRGAGLLSWAIIGIALLVYGFFQYLVEPVSVVFAPVAFALVIVYLLNPLVSALQRHRVPRALSVVVILLAFVAGLSVALAYLVPLITRQITDLIEKIPEYAQRVAGEINDLAVRRGWDFRVEPPEDLAQLLRDNRDTILGFLGGVGSIAGAFIHIVITALIGLVLSVYFLVDLPKIQQAGVRAVPPAYRDEVLGVLERIGAALGGFFRGQLLVATFVGVASAIALTIVKLPFAVLIGLVAGIFNLVPLIGPYIAGIPAVAVGLLSDRPIKALWAALALLIVQQIDNHVISPNVVGRTVKLHPITVMLALLVGATIAGILGMVVVIPVVAAIKIVAAHLWSRRREFGIPESIAGVGS